MDEGQFIVSVVGAAQQDLEELEDACRQLRDDLEEIDDVALTEVIGAAAPEGTRSSAFMTLSATLMVAIYGRKLTVMAADDLKKIKNKIVQLAKVFDLWLRRHEGTRAIIKLPNGTEADLTGLGPEGIRLVLEQVTETPESHK
jgi:hypothetical protein